MKYIAREMTVTTMVPHFQMAYSLSIDAFSAAVGSITSPISSSRVGI